MSNTYFDQRNKITLDKLSIVMDSLPSFCVEFFIGIQNRTSPLTRLNYAYDLRIFFDFLCKKVFKQLDITHFTLDTIEKLTAFDIERFLDYLNNYEYDSKMSSCGEKAKERKLATIRSFLKYYFNKDKLSSNVATKVEPPKIHTKNILRLEIDEVARLLDTIEFGNDCIGKRQQAYLQNTKLRDLAIITLFLGTGIRISELVGLDNTDIDLDNLSFLVTRKGGNKAVLYFSEEVAKALLEYINWKEQQIVDNTNLGEKITNFKKKSTKNQKIDTISTPNPALFVSLQGNRMSLKAVQNLVSKFCKIVSPLKPISPHKLRSTFGTTLYRQTGDIYVVAEVLGHRNINTTKKHYAESSEQIKRAASTAVKLRENWRST